MRPKRWRCGSRTWATRSWWRTLATGLELLHDAQPEVVLCDVGLPEMDGLEVSRRVRGSLARRRSVMVALTGWGMEEDRRRTQAAGFDHHLVKPVAPDRWPHLLHEVGSPS